MKNKVKTVAVALSGGVDSLVSGYLLKQQFERVFGIHFTTGYEKETVPVSKLEKILNIPVKIVDLSKSFENKVIRYFTESYLNGKTPNPCLICNKEIKFGTLMDHAFALGADCLATGHYARVVNDLTSREEKITTPCLKKGEDNFKDQSYFLSLLSASQFVNVIFPLSDMTKKEVKKLAEQKGLKPFH